MLENTATTEVGGRHRSPPAVAEDAFELAVADRPLTVAEAIDRARRHLWSLQQPDGHWCAELEGDTILESEYLLLLWWLGRGADPRFELACRYLREQQLEEGGWAIFPDGPSEVSPSVKAYLVLKLFGDDPQAPHMIRARESIRRLGGLAACNSFTKLYLAIFGLWSWDDAPAVPPELILLPRWFYFNIYEMSAWSRAIVIPLSVIWALKPRCELPIGLDELRVDGFSATAKARVGERFWFRLFRTIDRALKRAESLGVVRLVRERALRRCEQWTVERLTGSAGLAAIFPAIMNAVIALRLRGYAEDHPLVLSQLDELRKLEIVEGEPGRQTLRLQPCCSPVWDTALAINSLVDSGADPEDPRLHAGARWLIDHEVRTPGDWLVKNPGVEPGGWYFEYANECYPDCDDTGEVLAALGRLRLPIARDESRRRGAVRRGLRWQLAMQNRDGGWGAFDRECNKHILTYIPFADHNAMIDPSTTDVTARSVEALSMLIGRDYPAARRGVRFLERAQETDGSWYGRWGANYLYGTWLALSALGAVGRADSAAARRGCAWLLAVQNGDGGWGETLQSYVDPTLKGQGASSAAQTGWALLGLLAGAGDLARPENGALGAALERAVAWLLAQQQPDGSWRDSQWTGTGFPAVFYLRYHYYDRYFPLQALAVYERATSRDRSQPS